MVVRVRSGMCSNIGKCRKWLRWKWMTSKSSARRRTSSSIVRWAAVADFSGDGSSLSALSRTGTSRAVVTASPLENSVTSWPRATSSSVR